MAINPTTLKALIDTQITNETANFAITPDEVGGRLKDAIDYTTEQISGITFNPSNYDLDEFTNTGTDPFAHVSDIPSFSSFVPYTGATTNVDLGTRYIATDNIRIKPSYTSNWVSLLTYSGNSGDGTALGSLTLRALSTGNGFFTTIQPGTLTGNRSITIPNASGTLALTSDIPVGITGPQGLQGPQGFQGLQGPQGFQGLQGPQGFQGFQGLTGSVGITGPQGPTGTAPIATSGFISATSSFPYTLLSNTINQVISTSNFPLQRVQLPASTAAIGDRVTFLNAGQYMISVSANLVGGSIYYNGINGTAVSELITYPNQRYDFTYLGSASWLCAAVQSKLLLEYSAPLFQSGTDDPIPQSAVIDTLSVGEEWSGEDFRSVGFTRTTVGKYKIWVYYKGVTTNSSNLGVMFGDGICVTDGFRTNGTFGNGTSYSSWEFSTYTPGGTASDGLLKGTNAACFSVKLYQ
jgi:hypothetical protein